MSCKNYQQRLVTPPSGACVDPEGNALGEIAYVLVRTPGVPSSGVIRITDVTGRLLRTVPNTDGATQVTWGNDQRTLYFTMLDPATGTTDIARIDSAVPGTTPVNLTQTPVLNEFDPDQ